MSSSTSHTWTTQSTPTFKFSRFFCMKWCTLCFLLRIFLKSSTRLWDKILLCSKMTKESSKSAAPKSSNKSGPTSTVLPSTEVLASVTQAPLENEGSSGSVSSHFEKVVFGSELMISQITFDPKVTKMTLAVVKDSGWYQVDMTAGELYSWGKDAGCGIFDFGCPKEDDVEEICSEVESLGCSGNHMYRTKCNKNTFNNDCPIDIFTESCKVKPSNPDSLSTYGKDSVCLNTRVNSAVLKL